MKHDFIHEWRRAMIDAEIADCFDRVDRWVETVTGGGILECRFHGSQYAKVVEAKRQEQKAKRNAA